MSAVRMTLAAIAAALLATAGSGSASAQGQRNITTGIYGIDVDGKGAKGLKNKGQKKGKRGSTGDDSQHMNLRMQESMSQHSKELTTRSGVAKKQDATKKGMVKKMK